MDKINKIIDSLNDDVVEYGGGFGKDESELIDTLKEKRIKTRKENPSGFAKHLGIGKRHIDCDLSNFIGSTKFLEEWLKDKTNNILITGKNAGTGKTHLAVALMKYIGVNHPVDKIHPNNPGRLANDIIFISFTELMMEIRNSYNDSTSTDYQIIEKYSNIPYLFIDDIGAEKTSEHTVSVLYMIINKRYTKMLPTITTTNMTSKQMSETYHQRIVSRLASGVVVVLEGQDQRLKLDKVF